MSESNNDDLLGKSGGPISEESSSHNNISYFIGYYSKKNSLASESLSEEYPVHLALTNLLDNMKESESNEEKQKIIVKRLAESLKEFVKQEGKHIAKDIVTGLLEHI